MSGRIRCWSAASIFFRLVAGGSVAEVAATLREYRDAGFAHPVLIFRSPWDLETIERLPELRAALGAG